GGCAVVISQNLPVCASNHARAHASWEAYVTSGRSGHLAGGAARRTLLLCVALTPRSGCCGGLPPPRSWPRWWACAWPARVPSQPRRRPVSRRGSAAPDPPAARCGLGLTRGVFLVVLGSISGAAPVSTHSLASLCSGSRSAGEEPCFQRTTAPHG